MNAGNRKPKGSSGVKAGDDGNANKRWSWTSLRHDLAVGSISGLVVASLSLAGAVYFDDQRSERERRVENLRFVRERSSEERVQRPFRGLDLKEQSLSGLLLVGANLETAILEGADFWGTDLEDSRLLLAKIRGGKFGSTNLKDATLTHADLSDAELTVTDMSGSFLQYTDLSRATLSGVDLRNATLWLTRLDGANLQDVTLDGVDTSNVCYDKATKWPLLYNIPTMNVEACRNAWPGSYR